MKRTTVFLDEQTIRRLRREAHRLGVSSATLVREAVSRYLNAPQGAGGLPPIAGKFSSAATDTAERVDELLWQDPHA
jgi:hypothetical protein